MPPGKLIPIVFLPGIMGSNLRLSRERQELLKRSDNLSWSPDKKGDAFSRRNASAAARQMRLDPDEVEVDRYKVTDEKIEGKQGRRFDATGSATISSDQRHDNVPDDLGDVSKLLITDPKADPTHPLASNQQSFTAAQKARARGWSEVMFDAYGSILQLMERQLNDMLRREGKKYVVSPAWLDKSNPEALIGRPPSSFGVHDAQPLSEDDIRKIGNCWYPVHAFGYNWLRSNGEEGRQLAKKIELLIDTYNHNGFRLPRRHRRHAQHGRNPGAGDDARGLRRHQASHPGRGAWGDAHHRRGRRVQAHARGLRGQQQALVASEVPVGGWHHAERPGRQRRGSDGRAGQCARRPGAFAGGRLWHAVAAGAGRQRQVPGEMAQQ
ncbi:hypothetical protein ABL840_32240 [Variovorax sp. NFACC27]|uniref:hypothetical protein n=1 Tax=Variovorax sp. NFACC27 TaxID=1566274 RepID=UPI003AAB07FE